MDKIMIFGVFEFVGFHLCKRFLEEGYNVKGIVIDTSQEGLLEERRLEVGRNANFEEQSFTQWQEQSGEDNENNESVTMIFPLYDWYMTFTEAVIEEKAIAEPIFQYLNNRRERENQVVFLLPIHLLAEHDGSEGLEVLDKFTGNVRKIMTNCQFFFLPTLYGPWQPSTFLFQNAMLKGFNDCDNQTDLLSREWAVDAIFIDDALDLLAEIILKNKSGKFLMESGIENSWETCVDFLKMDQSWREKINNRRFQVSGQLERIILEKPTFANDALKIQLKHLTRLYGMSTEQ